MKAKKEKPWAGVFREPTHPLVEKFTASVAFDSRLYKYDIQGSIAHARMLAKCRLIPGRDARAIISGLREIENEIEAGQFPFDPALEDIHMNIEARLRTKIGEAGDRLHTGRSRNDQIALDLRLYLRDQIKGISLAITNLQKALVELAKKNLGVIMPGYTHLRRAQPVLFSHYLLAYHEMLNRDRDRFQDCLVRVNVMPLGSAALAGSSLSLDREYLARLLNFPAVTANSMDAVSDRDFVIEFLFGCALAIMHLSRFSEEMILMSSQEFGFILLPEAFLTGSSIMPQKQNPDVLELIRGKTGRVYGSLLSLLTVMKGLPLTYNRDMQEDKEPLFDAVDTVKASLEVLAQLIKGVKVNRQKMERAAKEGFLAATDLAEYLVKKGVPFRQAHAIVGQLVRYCAEKGKEPLDLSWDEFQSFSPKFGPDLARLLTPEASVAARRSPGGTALERVKEALERIDKEG